MGFLKLQLAQPRNDEDSSQEDDQNSERSSQDDRDALDSVEVREDGDLDEEEQDDDSGEMDLQKVIEYQHKILRKYTMTGMISPGDAPCLHDMVDNRNYRMICIFEVLT